MKLSRILKTFLLVLIPTLLVSGCAMSPGGIAASTTPIAGREYRTMGRAVKTDSRIYLLGFLPISGRNSTRDAIDAAVRSRSGDAMINVTVESYNSWWILFSKFSTTVEGDVIRFSD